MAAVAAAAVALEATQDQLSTKRNHQKESESSLRHYAACAKLLTQQILVLQQEEKTDLSQQRLLPPHLLEFSQQVREAAIDEDNTKQPASTAETTKITKQLQHQVQAHLKALRDYVPNSNSNFDDDRAKKTTTPRLPLAWPLPWPC
ncbi:hypothetical protein ACA910_017292 [Epithemia clementina (nom. ined.)]